MLFKYIKELISSGNFKTATLGVKILKKRSFKYPLDNIILLKLLPYFPNLESEVLTKIRKNLTKYDKQKLDFRDLRLMYLHLNDYKKFNSLSADISDVESSYVFEKTREITPFIETAVKNTYKLINNDPNYLALKKRKSFNINDLDQGRIVIFNIPFHFFHCHERVRETFLDIANFHKSTLLQLEELDIYIMPRFQYHLSDRNDLPELKKISYHTIGHAKRNLRIKESAFLGYFHLDPTGYSGWLSINNDNDLIEKIEKTPIEQACKTHTFLYEKYVVNKVSKYIQNENNSELPQSFLFLALQVHNDTVSELAYLKTEKLLNCAINICSELKINLVIKRHPKCNYPPIQQRLKKVTENSYPYIYCSDKNIHDLIQSSCGVITTNSGVGFESLIHLKPVITTGKSDYQISTTLVKCESELKLAIQKLNKAERQDTDFIKKFLHFYKEQYLYDQHSLQHIKARLELFLQK